jgi:hypothetical protein
MRQVYQVGNFYVAEVDHSATNDTHVTVDFLRHKPDQSWEVWQRGQVLRETMKPTEFSVE